MTQSNNPLSLVPYTLDTHTDQCDPDNKENRQELSVLKDIQEEAEAGESLCLGMKGNHPTLNRGSPHYGNIILPSMAVGAGVFIFFSISRLLYFSFCRSTVTGNIKYFPLISLCWWASYFKCLLCLGAMLSHSLRLMRDGVKCERRVNRGDARTY